MPAPLSAIYALALAHAGSADHIYVAGFDGYEPSDPRREEMLSCLAKLSMLMPVDELVTAVTPTTYPLTQGSAYAP